MPGQKTGVTLPSGSSENTISPFYTKIKSEDNVRRNKEADVLGSAVSQNGKARSLLSASISIIYCAGSSVKRSKGKTE